MEWIDRVFHAKYDTETNNVSLLVPVEGNSFFFEDELASIEKDLEDSLAEAMRTATSVHMDKTLQEDQSDDTGFPSAH